MIDPKLLRESFAEVAEQLATRGVPENFNKWQDLDTSRRSSLQELESLRADKNKYGPEIAKAKKAGGNADALIAQLKSSGEREKELEESLRVVETELQSIELVIPNIPDASVPVGADESANRIEKKWGDIPKFDFTPKPHWEVGENLGILDFEKGAALSGARFTVYFGDGARLERACTSFMLDCHRDNGYLEVLPPISSSRRSDDRLWPIGRI
ncbi:UNVERIFIED_CONTAM: hypothetical protein GTU68_048470 [Idotea baltica]|nr:hypothetical protein [Idotea baltica]